MAERTTLSFPSQVRRFGFPAMSVAGGLLLLILGALSTTAQADCDPNKQVCVAGTGKTLIAKVPYRGKTGSARINFYSAPQGKGNRKGVTVWVQGFDDPSSPEECLNRGDTTGVDPAEMPSLLGFDLYKLDFCDTTIYIQSNAQVVKELIRDQIRPSLGAGEKFAIGASSLGGVISRYALTQLESEGFDHSVDL